MSQDIVIEIKQALDTLYGNTDSNLKNQANTYLLNFQRSNEAWEIIFPLLSEESTSIELKIFISQTLKSKIQYDFHQLPKESIESLKNSVLQLLIQYSSNNNNIKNNKLINIQICLALTYFMIQDFSWANPVEDVIELLSNNNSIETLAEFLKLLPEELLDVKKTSLTNEEFEVQTKKLILNNIDKILFILTKLAENKNNNSTELNCLILNCTKSWLIDIPVQNFFSNLSLFNLIMESLVNNNDDDELFDTSIDCLSTIIMETNIFDNENNEINKNNEKIIMILYENLINLKSLIEHSWDEPEKIERATELFSIAGETWHVLIVKLPMEFKSLVEILLALTNYNEDLDIVKYTFKFWYDLKLMLISTPYAEAKKLFSPIYSEAVEILINHLKYPLSSNSTNLKDLFENNKKLEDQFKDFRYEIGDVLKDCCSVIGSFNALNIPFLKLQKIMFEQQQGKFIQWQEIECLLFSMRAMAKEVSNREDKILPEIMKFLVKLPENPKIRYSATLVLGRYTEWTSFHPEFLEDQLNYIISGFNQTNNQNNSDDDNLQIIIAASHALKYFCMDCSKALINYLEQLYNFYSNIENSLDIQSLYDVSEGIAYVLKELNDDQAKLYSITLMFWKATIEKLTKLNEIEITNANPSEADSFETKIADTIEIITIYVDILKPKTFDDKENAISNILIEIVWPLIISFLNNHGRSVKVSERCMKLIRKSLQNFKNYMLPVLNSIAEVLITGFKKYHYGCYLWVSGCLINEYYELAEVQDSIWNFSMQQIKNFITYFNELSTNEKEFEFPDLIEDFFRMINDILMFSPVNLIQNDELIQNIFQLSIKSLETFQEDKTLISVLQFLIDFYSWGFETPPISIVEDAPVDLKFKILNFTILTGDLLTNKLLNGLIFKFPIDCWYDSNELIISIIKLSTNFKENDKISINWINNFLLTLPPNNINEVEKLKLLKSIEVAIDSKNFRKVRSSINDFVSWYKRKNVSRNY